MMDVYITSTSAAKPQIALKTDYENFSLIPVSSWQFPSHQARLHDALDQWRQQQRVFPQMMRVSPSIQTLTPQALSTHGVSTQTSVAEISQSEFNNI